MTESEFVHRFTEIAKSPDPDLAPAALFVARLEYPGLEAERYLEQLDAMGRTVSERLASLGPRAGPMAHGRTISGYLFEDEGFAGNTEAYDDPRNSFLNQVLERRTGIPITLALVYIEVARRAGVRADGVNFPGHFLPAPAAGRKPAVRRRRPGHSRSVPRRGGPRRGGLPATAQEARRRRRRVRPAAARARQQAADPAADAAQPEAHLRAHALVPAGAHPDGAPARARPVRAHRAPGPRPAGLPSERFLDGAPGPGGLPALHVPRRSGQPRDAGGRGGRFEREGRARRDLGARQGAPAPRPRA